MRCQWEPEVPSLCLLCRARVFSTGDLHLGVLAHTVRALLTDPPPQPLIVPRKWLSCDLVTDTSHPFDITDPSLPIGFPDLNVVFTFNVALAPLQARGCPW